MFTTVLKLLLAAILFVGLIGCVNVIELDFPTAEDGFPIGFTRISDGVQIYLGMHKDDVMNVLGEPTGVVDGRFGYGVNVYGEYVGSGIEFSYNYDGIINSIGILAWEDWITVGGLHALIDDIEKVRDIFENGELSQFHNLYDSSTGQYRPFTIIDNPENPVNALSALSGSIIIGQPPSEFWEHYGYPRSAVE